MRGLIGVGLFLVAALAGDVQAQPWQNLLASPDWPWSAPQQPHPSVARVTVPQPKGVTALGSGTLVDTNDKLGLVITNWHVVDGAAGEIFVTFPDGFRSGARVLKVDRDWDLAALLIWKPTVKPVPLAPQAPKPGDMLTIAGYGSGRYRAASGRCTQYVAPGPEFPYEMIELAAAARQGDSGGPIFDTTGRLAGVLFGEAGGRTSGSCCRRVHQFLSAITMPTGGLSPAPAAIAAAATAGPPAAAASASPAAAAVSQGPVVPVRPHGSRQPAMQQEPKFAATSQPATATPMFPAPVAGPIGRSGEPARPATVETQSASGSQNRFRAAAGEPEPSSEASPSSFSDWMSGEPWEQAKSALAVLGAVSLVLHLIRARRAASSAA